jgi:kynurenine 3-monooxygenase
MRDKTASRVFRAKKKLDHVLEGLLPGIYLPLYAMVTFTRLPYSMAGKRARFQDRIVFGSLVGAASLLIIAVLLALFH